MGKDIVTIDGFKFYRNPESKSHHGRTYYVPSKAGRAACGHTSLHRYLWAKANGPIPDGFVIHHRDKNSSNNSLTNLECINTAAHGKIHGPDRGESNRQNIKLARAGANAWHSSKDGLEWHRAQSAKFWAAREANIKSQCVICGAECLAFLRAKKFCSAKCKGKYGETIRKDFEIRGCPACKVGYRVKRSSPQKCCSRSCEVSMRRRNRPSLQPDGC